MEENKTIPAPAANAKKKASKAVLRTRRICAVLLILLFVWWFNNYTIKTTKVTIRSEKVTSKVRIAVLSDQHVTNLGISNKRIKKRIEKVCPDIVVILGDMYSSGSSRKLMQKPVELTKSIINSGYTVYFVNGEHDNDPKYISSMKAAGAHVLDYKSEKIEINGNKLQLMGIDNVYYSDTFDLNNEFTLDRNCYNILLAHIPNYSKFAEFGADLTLCADTHGCMIQLPFGLGPAYDTENDEWFPEMRHKDSEVYDKGLFKYDRGYMFITSGLGVSPAPIRFNNRPEVAVIDIVPQK
jgi:hypothetical protein